MANHRIEVDELGCLGYFIFVGLIIIGFNIGGLARSVDHVANAIAATK